MKGLNEIKAEMQDLGISEYFEALAPLAKNAVRISLNRQLEKGIPVGASKFGGHPDLPADAAWFRTGAGDIPMSFIAQINFAETAPFDLEHRLPEQGMLYFFYDCSCDGMPWGFNPNDSDGWQVYFYNGDPAALSRREAPLDLTRNDNGAVFGCARLCFESAVELPTTESGLTNDVELPDDDELQDAYWEWLEDHFPEISNKLLGHADPIQGGMELECEYVTNGINCGTPAGYQIAKARGLDKNAARWHLLLQVDSDEDLGMMWGDLGRLYLWITEEDLVARRFEKSWLILQCG